MAGVIGWDIGGAHLKAARAEEGRVVVAAQAASPLRLGVEALHRAFEELKPRIGAADRHVVTMTAELADTFVSRADGVAALAAIAARTLGPQAVLIYAGRAGLVSPRAASSLSVDVASANWHASARLVAQRLRAALFVDMGSTTTDLVPVIEGSV
jgi:(4-(4-[2-(gamma-L-glutamylamino)ethyl]phenoxymethyl)furan-2-yl)methanamine synthase